MEIRTLYTVKMCIYPVNPVDSGGGGGGVVKEREKERDETRPIFYPYFQTSLSDHSLGHTLQRTVVIKLTIITSLTQSLWILQHQSTSLTDLLVS